MLFPSNFFVCSSSRSPILRGTAIVSFLLFAFTAIYTPIHLLTEQHTGDWYVVSYSSNETGAGKNNQTGHIPHPASDHVREFRSPDVNLAATFLTATLPPLIELLVPIEIEYAFIPFSEPTVRPPDFGPARPLQSRAPPTV